MAFEWAALMPHPPILVPQVGKGREKEAEISLAGALKLKEALGAALASGPPEVLLLLSPHQPHAPGALVLNTAPRLTGNLARFGAPNAAIEADCPDKARNELTNALHAAGIAVHAVNQPDISQDHGSIVPLLLIRDCFPNKRLPPLLVAGPSGLSLEAAQKLGEVLRGLGGTQRWGLLASGDLSHRLKTDGPYGFHPDGPVFDKAVTQALTEGSPAPLLALSAARRDNAAECGLRPVLALLALTRSPVSVFSYEGPFGVGYCNAFWSKDCAAAASQTPPVGSAGGHPYARLARQTVTAHLTGKDKPLASAIADDADLWSPRHGCFVSIKNRDGSLRGCIGTFLPTRDSLDQEIMGNAISAATRDPRFAPMTAEELDTTIFSVDVLSAPELVREGMELDPKIYGVIVSKEGRRGLLLPDLEGVDSVPRQLAIAASKAGIRDLTGAEIHRFTVQRYKEESDAR